MLAVNVLTCVADTVTVWLPPIPTVRLVGKAVMEKSPGGGGGGGGGAVPLLPPPPPHPASNSANAREAKHSPGLAKPKRVLDKQTLLSTNSPGL
jgi:hypothetical protein